MGTRDDIPEGPGAESEIQIEKIDLSEPENSGSVSVEDGQLVIHPEESTTVQVNDNDPVEANNDLGYVIANVPSYVPPEYESESRMKYGEDLFLHNALDHIQKTYGQHYANPEKQGIQVFDLWDSLNSLDTTARDTAIKYLARYGRKGGHNKIDLFKAIHYICMLNYATKDKQ
jgi:hypothetical protein